MNDLRVYEDDLDRLSRLAENLPWWNRWLTRWQIHRLRREVAVLRDHQIAAFLSRPPHPGVDLVGRTFRTEGWTGCEWTVVAPSQWSQEHVLARSEYGVEAMMRARRVREILAEKEDAA